MKPRSYRKNISCDRVTVAFLYTFSLSVWKRSDFEPSRRRHWFAFPDITTPGLVEQMSSQYASDGYKLCSGTPDTRKGVLPFFTLDDQRKTMYLLSPEYSGTLHGFLGNEKVKVSSCVRLSNIGVGTCCITVESLKAGSHKRRPPVDLHKISDFFGLVKNTWKESGVKELSLNGDTTMTTVFKMFLSEVDKLVKVLRGLGYEAKWVEKELPLDLSNGEMPFIVPELFETEQALTPFLMTILEFPEEVYDELFIHIPTSYYEPVHIARLRNMHNELANILYAIIRPDWGWGEDRIRSKVDPGHMDEFLRSHHGVLTNLNMMGIPFIAMGIRSCLIACIDKSGGSERVMIPATFDCIELLRMQWHFYILANAILDNEIENLIRTQPSADELAGFITLRQKLAVVLENIETFRWGGNALTTIYDEGERIFEIGELRSTILKKLELLNTLYEDVLELDRQRKLGRYLEQFPSAKQGQRNLEG